MVLAVDIGNSNIVIGCFREGEDEILVTERISTNKNATPLEFAGSIQHILEIHQINAAEITGSIVSSVVPSINISMQEAIEKVAHCPVIFVGPGVKTGLKIRIETPSQLGSDRVADAVAALSVFPPPIIIIDMGTATTFSVIDAQRQHIGGAIFPGVGISLAALTEKAAQLPTIPLTQPPHCIGRNTIDCMKSGILYGTAGCIDGMIDHIEEELGQTASLVATGGFAQTILPFCRHKIQCDPFLLLRGLQIIYQKNCGTTK